MSHIPRSSSILSRISIRTRLLVSIGTLLLVVIGAAILFAYHEVTTAANTVARERLQSLTKQFATITQQSTSAGLNRTFAVANEPAISSFLRSPSPDAKNAVNKLLEQFASARDPNNIQTELWTSERNMALSVPENAAPISAELSAEFQQAAHDPFRSAGALRALGGVMIGDFTAAILNERGTPIGFLVRWRRVALSNSPEQLRKLLGNDATVYFGNAGNDVWTDFVGIVPKPLPRVNGDLAEYNRDGKPVMALEQSIDGTPWAVAIEISNQAFANQSRQFLRRTSFVGALILLTGLAAAFITSRSVMRPLRSLTNAAKAISAGDYSHQVVAERRDELGELADSFNSMVAKMRNSQRELEQKVKERTAQLEAAAGAILLVDSDGLIRTANAKAAQLFGYSAGELLGRPLETLVPDRYREAHVTLRNEFLHNPMTRPMGVGRELFGRRRDGTEVPIEIGLNPITTEQGVFVLANIIDITERRRAEEQFRVVVEASPNGILMVNKKGIITLANTQTEQLFGYNRGELLGQTVESLIPERYRSAHPEHRGGFFDYPSSRAMGAGRDLYGRRKDGTEVPVEIGLRPIQSSDGLLVLASIIDITERKRREEQLRMLSTALESAANAVVITDAYGKIVWVNQAFTESSGYSPEEVLGKNPRVLKSGEQSESFYKDMWGTITAGKVWRNTLINRRKDGSLINEEMTITPIRDRAGAITQFVAIKQDITQLQEALSSIHAKNDELTAMTQQLWQASRLATVGELAASIAHELNNPLATISLRLETLGLQVAEDQQKTHAVKIVADEVERMGKLVGNLLQFSRRTHQQISTLDVRDELNNSMELIEYHLRSNKITVQREYADDLPMIQADRQQLRQVFLNLFTNASDAIRDGGSITVRATLTGGDEDAMVKIEVIDTGAGIPTEALEKVWDPFFTTKPEGKGTGLGLAICKRVVEEHHGTITIDNAADKGTRVTIRLPATSGHGGRSTEEYRNEIEGPQQDA
jgi:PAS domain S-box-containing protein